MTNTEVKALKERFDQIDTLIFDYDGTIHNSIHLYGPAFRKAFDYLVDIVPDIVEKSGYQLNKRWTDKEISHWLGFTKDEMWASFMPLLPDAMKARAGKMIGEEMNRLLVKKQAHLYDGSLETLSALKEAGYHLVFLSNCSVLYMEAHSRDFNLDKYFERFACAGQYPGQSKKDILGLLIKEGHVSPETSVMIGDRAQDMEAGLGNGLQTIGSLYGFARDGELKEASAQIMTIKELKDIFL